LTTTISPNGRKPLSRDTVLCIRGGLLAPAYKWGASPKSGPLVSRNPMLDSDAPKPESTFRRAILFTPSEYRLFLTVARTVDAKWAEMTETAAAIGPRFGEIIMVEAKDVDRARAVIHIQRRFTGGYVEDGTKNGTTREVPIPHPIMTRIIEPRMAGGGLLFPGPGGGPWSYAADWERWDATRTALAAAGLPRHISHHSLRHGYSTWLKSQRIDLDKVEIVMGHLTKHRTSMSARYNQLTEADLAMIRRAITKLVCS
jgi:integrase